jgi:acyl dehydratase
MEPIRIGDFASQKKRFTLEDVKAFAELTGDYNPVHFDENFASQTIFKKPIVHGPLVITIITSLFANKLPGPGSVYLSHEVKYLAPVFHNEEILATVEIIDVNSKGHIFLKTKCFNENGELVLDGIARLKKY